LIIVIVVIDINGRRSSAGVSHGHPMGSGPLERGAAQPHPVVRVGGHLPGLLALQHHDVACGARDPAHGGAEAVQARRGAPHAADAPHAPEAAHGLRLLLLHLVALGTKLGRVHDARHDEHHDGEAERGQEDVHADLQRRRVHRAMVAGAATANDFT